MSLEHAFFEVCKEAKRAQGYYVSLMEEAPYHGGPEEGGWWGTDLNLIAYAHYPTEEQAEAAATEVRKLAKELEDEARRGHGNQCLREMDWLDERGLDYDYLPEPNGPSRFIVCVTEGVPQEYRGSRHYE